MGMAKVVSMRLVFHCTRCGSTSFWGTGQCKGCCRWVFACG